MPTVPVQPINLNKFWEKTPTPLKYILLIGIIAACLYFLFLRKVDSNQIKELDKIEKGIDVTYDLVEKFEAFQKYQNEYDQQITKDLQNIYILITELNVTVNTKFDYVIKNSGKYNQEVIEKMKLLNDSFEKLSKAYQPLYKPYIEDPEIGVKKTDKPNE